MQIHYEFNERDLGHGASDSVLHPLVIVAVVVTIALMIWRPRKYAIAPLLLCTFLVPRGQELLLLGAHFYVRQILVLVGFIYVMLAGFRVAGGWNVLDTLFVAWACYRAFAITVTNWPGGTMEQLAFLMTAMCGYFLFRCLFQSEEDLIQAAKALAIATAILGPCMVYEQVYRINLFGTYLGGVEVTPLIRDGVGRAQGSFGVSILAGCFGATLVPLFVWLWKKNRILSAIGIAGSTLMVVTTVSSTPLMAYVAGILGLLLWPLRRSMRALRWGIVGAIVAMAAVMKAPVWFLIAHISVIGGSGGYDRAFLIDTCVRHFKDWWLIGTNQNGGWGYDMWDLSDQFVAEAEMGGILTLICFIAIITKCFSRLGTMRKRVKPEEQWLLWCLGCIMLAHIFGYFGVAYWDQTQIWWFAFLAMIAAITAPLNHPALAPAAEAPAASKLPQYGKASPVWGARPAISASDGNQQKPWMLGR